ncbi:MAG: hypothetical protein L3J43_11500 [Sulfurovum sp.]|nr:hypothetical protein [Sulfurovum sp.]
MRNNFEATHIKKSAKALDRYIMAAESYAKINKKYEKNIFNGPSRWKRFLDFFKA